MRKLIFILSLSSGVCLVASLGLAQDASGNTSAEPTGSTNKPPASTASPTPDQPPSSQTNLPAPPQLRGMAPTRSPENAATAPTPAPAPPATQPTPPVQKEMIGVIDFQGTPLQAVLEYYSSQLAKRSIISAPNLAGTIYFRSQTGLTREEAMQALDSVLAINGIAIVPLGEKFMKVVQIASAKQEGLSVGVEARTLPPADTLMTQIIPMKFAEVADIVGALQPYMHAYGQLIPLQKSNALLITDTGANINQMLEIVKYIDQPTALRMQTKVYEIKHAKASEIVARLQAIITETQQLGGTRTPAAGQPPGQPIRVQPQPRPGQPAAAGGASVASDESVVEGKVILTADERTNKLFILSRPSNFDFFDKIIAELDAKVEPDVIMKVISLQYATAEDAASLVNALITGGTLTVRRTSPQTAGGRTGVSTPPPPPTPVAIGGGAGGGATESGFLQFAQGVRILPDPRTNSLLVMATKEDMKRIEALIESVDTSVAQVQIEVVIAEVTLNNELDVGVNVFKRLFDEGQVSQTGGYSTDGNSPVELPKASDLASMIISNLPTAAALASGPGGLTYFATFQNLKLDMVLHALASTSKAKVLSTPVIQTMDNQEASILVGESVPVPVSQVSSLVSGQGTQSTGQLNSNIEYKDAAIELKVTPRINPEGYVRMDIEQKVNDFGAPVQVNGTSVPSITKREAKSSVAVQNRSTIALGGLIKENKLLTEKKVPFFGDIPLLGQLFKSKATTKIRNELIIFIRPTVMRTDAEAVAVARYRSRQLKSVEDLELEKQFMKDKADFGEPGLTNGVPENAAPVPAAPELAPADQPSSSNVEEADRYAAKLKAIEEQQARVPVP